MGTNNTEIDNLLRKLDDTIAAFEAAAWVAGEIRSKVNTSRNPADVRIALGCLVESTGEMSGHLRDMLDHL